MPDICQIYARYMLWYGRGMVHILSSIPLRCRPFQMGFQIPMDPLMTVAHCGTSMTIFWANLNGWAIWG